MTNEEQLYTLAALSCALPDSETLSALVDKITGGQWRALLDADKVHRVSALIFRNLKSHNLLGALPDGIRNELQRESRGAAAINLLLMRQHETITNAAAAAAVSLAPLKGIRMIGKFYSPDQRPLTDIDYLIKPAQRPDVKALMLNLGYNMQTGATTLSFEEKYSGEYHFEKIIGGMPVVAEMHTELLPLAALRSAFPIRMQDFWNHATDENGASMLRIEHELLFYSAHLAAVHCFSRLIWLADIDRLCRAGGDIDWLFLAAETRKSRAGALMFQVLKAAERLYHTPVPDSFFKTFSRQGSRVSAKKVDAWIAGAANPIEIGLVPFILSDNPARFALRHVFPPPDFLRMRYNIPAWQAPLFYLARPAALAKKALSARKRKPEI
jgi:hypothetical protein